MWVDLGLLWLLGFLGSFGHCAGMCGPLAIALGLTGRSSPSSPSVQSPGETVSPFMPEKDPRPIQVLQFHLLLNLGRLVSYALVGGAIAGMGSILVAGGQMAGIGSLLRRSIAIGTGGLLVMMSCRQLVPQLVPQLGKWHLFPTSWHAHLQHQMTRTVSQQNGWTPLVLGLLWGLIPCGFLYVAQIKAAAAGSGLLGACMMLTFGLGTLPMMLGVGIPSAWLSRHHTRHLAQLGGAITLLMGILLLTRTGDVMVDYTGHLALVCLALALIARPIQKVWTMPFQVRRILGVSTGMLAIAHTLHMLEHSWQWQVAAVQFMIPQHRWAMVAGGIALLLLLLLTVTSTDWAQRSLGKHWRKLHLWSVPALILAGAHTILAGSSYLGSGWHPQILLPVSLLSGVIVLVLAVRSPQCWRWLGVHRWYTPSR